jgi:HAD superfamily hydrolase (TIGR01450 family)
VRLADSYDGFLIDLDGVVWLGHDMLPGAADTLSALSAEGKRIAFVTNSPRLTPGEHAGVLRSGGVPVTDEQVVTAASTLIGAATERLGPEPRVIAIGTEPFLRQVDAAGIVRLDHGKWDEAEAVLVSGHVDFNYAELKAAAMAARNGALLAATGRDPTMPMPDGLWPGTGSILAAIETASETRGFITGKPERRIFETGLGRIGASTASASGAGTIDVESGDPLRVAMIGDRLDTDVGGGQGAGLDGILVTGDRPAAEHPEVTPDHVISSLTGLLEPAG